MASAENINPEILVWARESAGLSVDEAANRIGLTSSERASAVDKLAALESGEKSPTRAQLAKLAAVYRRPLVTFYMKALPKRAERGEDFRSLAIPATARDNALLDALLRDIRARQEMVKSLLEDEDETSPLPFVGSASIAAGVDAVVRSIAKTLNYDPFDQAARKRSANPDNLFREIRTRSEKAGIFVLLVGDLGSHHSAISEGVFRGLAIADSVAPFVVINDQDAKSARTFTLIHELAHIWLGQTGISGTPEAVVTSTPWGRTEQFCNDVAGEFLLPSSAFTVKPSALVDSSKESAHRVISDLAQTWAVSEPMVAHKLNRLGWIGQHVYRELTADYAARWNAFKLRAREKHKEFEGGPSYYVVKQFKLGHALIDLVRRTLRDNALSHTKAAKVLGVKASSVEPLIRSTERSRTATIPELRG